MKYTDKKWGCGCYLILELAYWKACCPEHEKIFKEAAIEELCRAVEDVGNALVSLNVLDSNMEYANLVDTTSRIVDVLEIISKNQKGEK